MRRIAGPAAAGVVCIISCSYFIAEKKSKVMDKRHLGALGSNHFVVRRKGSWMGKTGNKGARDIEAAAIERQRNCRLNVESVLFD
jgi:hypothetical protein